MIRLALLFWLSSFATAAESLSVVTAYCPGPCCCPGTDDDRTATMTRATKWRGVAVDPKRIPYGSLLYVPGYGFALADDTGAAMRNAPHLHVDVRFKKHRDARIWGARYLVITWDPWPFAR